jgi:hypothetical protein
MQKFTFVCKKHEEYGSLGWALKCKPHFEPLGGMTVAHDVMEHFPRDNGTLAAEWQAFGAMMRIRHEGNWWSNQGNTKYQEFGDQAYVDLFDHYRKVVYGELSVDEAPRTMKLEDDLEEQIQKMVANFRREIDREVDPDDQSCDVDFSARTWWDGFALVIVRPASVTVKFQLGSSPKCFPRLPTNLTSS